MSRGRERKGIIDEGFPSLMKEETGFEDGR
jgi:hypothetical protein